MLEVRREMSLTRELKVRYYLTPTGEQRAERTLLNDGEIVAVEDYSSMARCGELYKLDRAMVALHSGSGNCTKCRYRIGDYTGDAGYLLYVIFKTRIRLKFLKFKHRIIWLITK